MSAPPSHARPALVAPPATVAAMGRRFAAYLLDGLVALVALVPALLASLTDGGLRSALLVAAGVLVVGVVVLQWVWHGTRGWTLGRLALGLRTVDVETLRPIGLGRVLVRGLVVAAGSLVLGVGQLVVLLSPLFDATGRNRGWHDKAAGDEVIDVRAPRSEPLPQWFAAEPGDVRVPVGQPPPRVPRAVPTPAAGSAIPPWATGAEATATVTGSQPLVLAPLSPREHGPDVDTRAIPTVRVAPSPRVTISPASPASPASPVPPVPPVRDPSAPSTDPGLDPELELTRRAVPRPAEPVVVEVPSTSAELVLSDGRRVVVDGVALVGRNPAAAVDVQLVRVIDPGRSVSKTHLQVAVSPSGVWVADRGSTNGTVVTLPDGAQVVCPVDHPVRLRAGSTVRFGDYSFVVVRGPAVPSS